MGRKVTRGVDPPEVEGYQWDGSKLIMIAKLNSNGTFHSRKWSCVWRPDVGSSLYARSDWMRAGGVGGVAWMQTGAAQSYSYGTGSGEVHVPLADHMGNVRHYYQFKASGSKVTGQLVASYEYDAFGREVRAWGLNTPATNQPPGLPASRPWADLLPFHYSSKLRDVDSGFNYYGYRFYDPGAGRWLNRDPIGERGGLNLYGMVGNDAVGRVDVLGLRDCHIRIYVGHDTGKLTDTSQPIGRVLDPKSRLAKPERMSAVCCNRKLVNEAIKVAVPSMYIPDKNRRDNTLFPGHVLDVAAAAAAPITINPIDPATGKPSNPKLKTDAEGRTYGPDGRATRPVPGDQSVATAFQQAVDAARAEAGCLCENGCDRVIITAWAMDKVGGDWMISPEKYGGAGKKNGNSFIVDEIPCKTGGKR